jgi:hypothetical protein
MLLALRYVDVVIVNSVAFTLQLLLQVDPAFVAVGSSDGELAGEHLGLAERSGIVARLRNKHPALSAKKVATRVPDNNEHNELHVAKNKKKKAEMPGNLAAAFGAWLGHSFLVCSEWSIEHQRQRAATRASGVARLFWVPHHRSPVSWPCQACTAKPSPPAPRR